MVEPQTPVRVRLRVTGLIQGVGFRPFVYRLAVRSALTGTVVNTTAGVRIEVQGSAAAVAAFPDALRAEARPPIRIEAVAAEPLEPVPGESRFLIAPSEAVDGAASLLPADLATCEECREETLRLPGRRRGYAFTNCTFCGPRYTIVRAVPYDRPATTMAGFELCPDCRREYRDPLDRRYHAQPIACPACGPRLRWRGPDGRDLTDGDPLDAAATALRDGRRVALKGIGGFLLACDAADARAVAALRARKHRGRKPFAVMAADLEAAREIAVVAADAAGFLASPAAPILLLPAREDAPLSAEVAPGQDHLGVMLPYSPLHHLLFARGAPRRLVMTSGNRRDEPIAVGEEAFERLAGIADGFLDHDRPIWNRCDDSVAFVDRGTLRLLRRARGYVPVPTPLPFAAPPLLAVGGLFKGAICFAEGRRAILSQHLGDTDQVETLGFLDEVREKLGGWLRIAPTAVACDPHPGYAVSALARRLGLPVVEVQHHHAHVAAVLAEAGVAGPAVGLALDGTGFGEDGTIWGGEVLVADCERFRRVGRLRPLPLPGGDAAIRQPVRTALAYLEALGIEPPAAAVPAFAACDPELAAAVRHAARAPRGLHTSSAGRLFDAVAVLLGAPGEVGFEGEAAMGLEVQARRAAGGGGGDGPRLALPISRREGLAELDPGPLLRELVRRLAEDGGAAARDRLAWEFHLALADSFAALAALAASLEGLGDVALSGGVFQNRLLLEAVRSRLETHGLRVHVPALVPANDGGLALGQVVVAAARRRRG